MVKREEINNLGDWSTPDSLTWTTSFWERGGYKDQKRVLSSPHPDGVFRTVLGNRHPGTKATGRKSVITEGLRV